MSRLQAFKYERKPNGEQQRQMRRFAGSCRFVYNQALALQKERYERGEKRLGYAGLCKALTAWKAHPQRAWLNETPSQALQQSLKNLGLQAFVWVRGYWACIRRPRKQVWYPYA